MIAWKSYATVEGGAQNLRAVDLGDAATSNWLGLKLDLTLGSGVFQVVLPLASRSIGRLFTCVLINPGSRFISLVRSGSDRVRINGADQSSATAATTKRTITLQCDGTRWNVLHNDGGWS